jgi:hypothetical protein
VVLAASAAASAFAVEPPEFQSSFGPDGTASSDFGQVGSVSVDQQTAAVYVLDVGAGVLYKFDKAGKPLDFGGFAPYISGNEISGLSPSTGRNESEVAVDSTSHVIYVTERHSVRAFQQNGEPAQFGAGPSGGTNEIAGFGELLGIAVDGNGDIYASDYAGTISIYAPTGAAITSFAAVEPGDLAVAADGIVYVVPFGNLSGGHRFTPDDFPVTPTTTYSEGPAFKSAADNFSPVSAAVDASNGSVYFLESNSLVSRVAEFNESDAFIRYFAASSQDGELSDFGDGVAIVDGGESFYVGNTDTAEPGAGASKVEIFGYYEGPPLIGSIAVSAVTAHSATLRARINPGSAETTYHFEYGLEDCSVGACASVPATGAGIGNGHKGVSLSQDLAGLQANTTYHYRVVADNEYPDSPVEGTDHTFTTQTADLGFQLSDSRAWEMVSPPDKHGALLRGSSNDQIQAAANGDGLVYVSRGSIEPEPEGTRSVEGSTILARRTADGWQSRDIAPPNNRVTQLSVGFEGVYKLFSRDLSRALLEPRSDTPLSPDASERTPYLRRNTEPPTYTPLVTEANVPPGTEFGGDPSELLGSVGLLSATPDLSHIVLRSKVPLVAGAPPAPAQSLYLWTAGQLRRVSVLPAAEGAEGGKMVATRLIGSGPGSVRHAISGDGSRVFWSAGVYDAIRGDEITALYLRDTGDEETVRLDPQSGASGAGEPRPSFQGASADGTVVFFSDSQQLTEDASPDGRDLYRCEIPIGSAGAGCSSLVDITTPSEGSGESADVQDIVPGLGDDGSTIYFVARAVLDSAANDAGENAVAGEPNLYVWREGHGVRFIATLSEEDANDWGGDKGLTVGLSAAASPSGRYLSFMSQRSLTGKDNLDATSGEPVQQVFRYDATTEQLSCISCNPTGAAPVGESAELRLLVDPRFQWIRKRVAAVLPEPTVIELNDTSIYSPRAVLDNGRVFFNAVDSLVPADSNGEWDVYQYEPTGVGDCTESSGDAVTSRTAGGCVSLISSGTGEEETGFLDASETGDDVFFLTPAKLNVIDGDSELDVYDARVNGIPETLPPQTECLGEACQPLPATPNDPTPASAAFQGPGNLKQGNRHCRKGKRRVRRHGTVVCVHHKQHRQRKDHKPGRNDRGVGR